MIVSVSHRTDIPAFYGSWFAERLDSGHVRVANPMGGADYTVPLGADSVDGFVFWTRNVAPFVPVLRRVWAQGTPFVIQHTVLGYPRELDRSVPAATRTVPVLKALGEEFGPDVLVWRYDPIVTSSLTPADFHRRTFAKLARALAGVTTEVVVSAVHPYRKTRKNLDAAATQHGFAWTDPSDEDKRALLGDLAEIADGHGMALTVCAQPHLAAGIAEPARCVDARRLERVSARRPGGVRAIAAPVRGNRPDCLCHESRDIGAYETCPHGCVYCYAVTDHRRAASSRRQHRSDAEFLASSRHLRAPERRNMDTKD